MEKVTILSDSLKPTQRVKENEETEKCVPNKRINPRNKAD